MANLSPTLEQKLATPTLEQFKGIKHWCTVIGASVTQVPAINLNFRKGIILQNKHASNVVYVGGGIPYLVIGSSRSGDVYSDDDHDKRTHVWRLSGSGSNEWYLLTAGGTDPAMEDVTYLYYRTLGGTTDTLGTSGSPGSLAGEHKWGFGNSDTLGFTTLYMQTDGSLPANNPKKKYGLVLGYYFTLTAGDTTETGGMELGPLDSMQLTADGSVKVFCIASSSNTPVGSLEVV